ncbi:MAG: restriction endonuclease subunit S [Neisseriales bacterium]|nr:MAG: restriction endonuclease subunit S [Neisseriales bacterium]
MKLNELVEIKIGLTLERKKANIASTKTFDYMALTLKSFTNSNGLEKLQSEHFIANSEIGAQYLTNENDVIMRLRSPSQAIFIDSNNTGLVVSSLMAIITNIFPNVLNSKYLTHYLNSKYIQNQLVKNTQGTAIPMIKTADLMELEINLPPLEKQQKIVNYIDTANQEIDLLGKLINEKNKLKTEIFETIIK